MEVKINNTKNINDKLEVAKKFIFGKKRLLEEQFLEHKEELDKINQELIEISKLLEKEKENKDVNLSLFSPYSREAMNQTECKLLEKIRDYNDRIAKLNILIEEERGELENYKVLEEVIDERKDGLQELNICTPNEHETSNETRIENTCSAGKIGNIVIDAQELERNRIARDLHDYTVQNLTALVHKAELCTKLIDIDPIRIKLELVSMIEVLRTTINEMRAIIYDLRPMSLNDLGLVPTIEALLEDIKSKTSVQTFLVANKEVCGIPSIINLTLYRIIQEACNNVVKHANAATIKINLTYFVDKLQLEINDDGNGFDINSVMNDKNCNSRNFGLSIMKERVKLLNGEICIDSKIHQGTKIKIVVPYCNNEEEHTK